MFYVGSDSHIACRGKLPYSTVYIHSSRWGGPPKSRYYARRIWGVTERQLDALSVTGKDISFQNGLYVHVWNGMSLNRSKPCLFCRSGTALNRRSETSLNCRFETMANCYFETFFIPDFKSLVILIPNQE